MYSLLANKFGLIRTEIILVDHIIADFVHIKSYLTADNTASQQTT